MASNVRTVANDDVFAFDPSKAQGFTNRFKTISGTPSISSSKLRLNAAVVQSLDSFLFGRLVMNITVPAAPTGGDVRKFGFISASYATAGSAYFDIADTAFTAKSYDENGNAETTTIAWSSDWNNVAIEYRIEWRGDQIYFYVADVLKATHTGRLGYYPQGITLRNSNVDNMDVNYVVMNDIAKMDRADDDSNVTQIGGVAIDLNSGTTGGGTQRVVLGSGATSSRTTVTPSLSSQALIAANSSRKGLRITHTAVDPAQNLWVAAAATATSAIFFTRLVGSGEVNLFDGVEWPYSGQWSVISDVASGTIQVYELT